MQAECRMMNAESRSRTSVRVNLLASAHSAFIIQHSAFPCSAFPSDSHDRVRPRQACAEGDEDDDVALLQLSGAPGLVQRNRDARRGGVAVAVDVDEDLVLRQAEL